MLSRGEFNLGQLCREELGNAAYSIGFGTNSGIVVAASDWDGPMEIKKVCPALEKSYERIFHQTAVPNFMLNLRTATSSLLEVLSRPRLQRAIGVIYRPETELQSYYFQAELSRQFDEYIWLEETRALTPFGTIQLEGFPDTHPFAL